MSSQGIQPAIEQQPGDSQIAPSSRARWVDLGLVLFISFADPILNAVFVFFHPKYLGSPSKFPWFDLTYLLLRHGSGFLILWYVLSRQKRRFRSIGISFRWSDPLKGVGLLILAAIIVAGFQWAVLGFDHAFGIVPDSRHMAEVGWKERSVTELIHGISSPIFEEVLVRGYLMTEIIELGKSSGLAVLASVILQTSYHVYYGFGTAISLSGTFLVFAAYFSKYRRLMPIILAHVFWDVTSYFVH